jgi:hypothetical protein
MREFTFYALRFTVFRAVRWRTSTAMPADSLVIDLGFPTHRNALKNKRGMILV